MIIIIYQLFLNNVSSSRSVELLFVPTWKNIICYGLKKIRDQIYQGINTTWRQPALDSYFNRENLEEKKITYQL